MKIQIHCSSCNLYLGEIVHGDLTPGADITCPLCIEIRETLKFHVGLTERPDTHWQLDVTSQYWISNALIREINWHGINFLGPELQEESGSHD